MIAKSFWDASLEGNFDQRVPNPRAREPGGDSDERGTKTREADGKTPLGQYALAAPRRSPGFGTFILIGYPTVAQVSGGYTGSAVGVHGPKRMRYPWLGFFASFVDWTAGCVALGSDEEVDRIAAWVKAHPNAQVVLR